MQLRKLHGQGTAPNALEVLQDLTQRCDPFQRVRNVRIRFRVSFGAENVLFGEKLLLDVMYLHETPI